MKDHGSPGSDYGSDYECRQYLKTQSRKKNNLMKQFCKLESGLGNSDLFRRGYDKIKWNDDDTK